MKEVYLERDIFPLDIAIIFAIFVVAIIVTGFHMKTETIKRAETLFEKIHSGEVHELLCYSSEDELPVLVKIKNADEQVRRVEDRILVIAKDDKVYNLGRCEALTEK